MENHEERTTKSSLAGKNLEKQQPENTVRTTDSNTVARPADSMERPAEFQLQVQSVVASQSVKNNARTVSNSPVNTSNQQQTAALAAQPGQRESQLADVPVICETVTDSVVCSEAASGSNRRRNKVKPVRFRVVRAMESNAT